MKADSVDTRSALSSEAPGAPTHSDHRLRQPPDAMNDHRELQPAGLVDAVVPKRYHPTDDEEFWEATRHLVHELQRISAAQRLTHASAEDAHRLDAEAASTFRAVVASLLPNRYIAVRVLDLTRTKLRVMGANADDVADSTVLRISREGLAAGGLDEVQALRTQWHVTDTYQSPFADHSFGFDTPLLDGETLLGIVDLAADHATAALHSQERDRRVVRQLSLHLANYLTSARLSREATSLRHHVDQLFEQVAHAERLATIGQLAAGVVHELNNPLTTIAVCSEYLLQKSRNAGAAPAEVEKLQRIVHSAERIARFTRDLVAYARPSTDRPHRLLVRDVLEKSLAFCEHLLRNHQVSVETTYEPLDLSFQGVDDQLLQVFINLVTNACHAMTSESPAVVGSAHSPASVSSAESSVNDATPSANRLRIIAYQAGDNVCVEVQDNGQGIAAEHIEKIFQPFFSTKGQDKGTGLGLSIVKSIIDQHRGSIQVRSIVHAGSTFTVYLPLHGPPGKGTAQPAASQQSDPHQEDEDSTRLAL